VNSLEEDDNKMKNKSELIKSVIETFVLFFAVCFLPYAATSAGKTTANIEDTRAVIEKWVDTQRVISQEKRDLALAKEMLNARIELLQREIESLRSKIDEAKTSIAEADKKRDDMIKENEKLKQASAALNDTLVSLEEGTKRLLKRLPDPIRERVKPLSQRLPENSSQTKLSVAERFQNIVGILNEVDKFNREISMTSEVRTLADGSSVEVTALYIGIGQAYYASANGKVAGTGKASEEGWVWKPDNEAAAQIAETIAILKNEKVASFVQLPVEIK
jgi:FtsZ-binding cell division protein ZapB